MTASVKTHASRDCAAVAAHMVACIPRTKFDTPVDRVIEVLHRHLHDYADTIFVRDDAGQLKSVVRISTLFADGSEQIGDTMEE